MSVPVIAVFDIGKTNKKLFLIDEQYKIVFEHAEQFPETVDEDGDPCEDVHRLTEFIRTGITSVLKNPDFKVRAVNATAYGASFVHLDSKGSPVTPLYNYLKPFPAKLQKQFYDTYGGEKLFSFQTASPVLGSLNSGLQLYRIKHENPSLFQSIRYSLHLPQYIAYLIHGNTFSEITSIGCHTNLWNFQSKNYHYWVKKEGLDEKFPQIAPTDMVVYSSDGHRFSCGIGVHDSSSALIPYLLLSKDPFVLISTGTWAITLNPFNSAPLTRHELECDCLCYLKYTGDPVKASRLFAGHFHDIEVERISQHFNQQRDHYLAVPFSKELMSKIDTSLDSDIEPREAIKSVRFSSRDLSRFSSGEEAYHQLVFDIAVQQQASTNLILNKASQRKIFVDGGFGNNAIYMNLLASLYKDMEVYSSSIPQATALGAAMVIHSTWNGEDLPTDIIRLKHYPAELEISN